MTEFIELESTIDLSKWNAAIASMLADAASIQTALTGFVATIEIDSDISEVEGELAGLENAAPEIFVDTDYTSVTDATDAVEDIPPEWGVEVETGYESVEQATDAVEDIPPEWGVEVETDYTSVDEAILAFDEIPPETTTEIEGNRRDIEEDIASIKQSLDTVRKLAIVDFIFNIPETWNKFVDTLENLPGISFLASTDEAMAHIQARTGQIIPGLEDVINSLYIEEGNKESIGDVLTFLIQNGETATDRLKDLADHSLDFAEVWGVDAVQALATAQQMVKAGLTPTMEEAFNVMTLGFQSGANAKGDFLSFLEKGAANFVELGLTGQDAVSLAVGAVNAGVPDLQRYGQLFMGLRKDLAKGGEETQQMLADLQLDPTNLGLEGYTAIIEHLQGIEDQAIQTQAITDTFGARAQGLTAPQIFALPDTDVLEEDIEGLSDITRDVFESNIGDALEKAGSAFEVALTTAFDNALNVSGFLDKITGAATTFADSIKEGMTLGQALEISLALPEGSFSRFESSVGNFAIGVLQLIAGVQDLSGHGEAAAGTRATIARMAETQLAFDLQVANPDEVAGIIQTALDRGVTESGIQPAIEGAVTDLVEAGNLEEADTLLSTIEQRQKGLSDTAQDLVEQYGGVKEVLAAFEADRQAVVKGTGSQIEEQLRAIDELRTVQGVSLIDTDTLSTTVDDARAALEDQLTEALNTMDIAGGAKIAESLGLDSSEFAVMAQEALTNGLVDAVQAGDWTKVKEVIAAQMGLDENFELPVGVAGAITKELQEAVAGGDVATTQTTAGILGFAEESIEHLTEVAEDNATQFETDMGRVAWAADTNFQAVGTAVDAFRTKYEDAKRRSADAAGEIVASTEDLAGDGRTNIDVFTAGILAMSGALMDTVTNLAGPLGDFASTLASFVDTGTSAIVVGSQIGAQGGVTPSGDTFGASGGNFGAGMHVFGEQGPELAFLNQDVSLLNNRTSEAFMAGAQMAGGGTTVNMTNVFNNASAAASIGGINMVNNQLRGYMK